MRRLEKVDVSKVTKADIAAGVRFLDEGGSVAKAFMNSLAVGGVIRDDVMKVAGAVTALMNCGLTREAVILLVQAKCPNQRNGRPMQDYVIENVLDALGKLDEFVVKPK